MSKECVDCRTVLPDSAESCDACGGKAFHPRERPLGQALIMAAIIGSMIWLALAFQRC
jgi:hypothetical protein